MLVQYDDAEKRREMAKNSLERYTHYYERWATNQLVGTVSLPSTFSSIVHISLIQ